MFPCQAPKLVLFYVDECVGFVGVCAERCRLCGRHIHGHAAFLHRSTFSAPNSFCAISHGHSCLSPTMSHHGSQEPSVRNSIAGILSRELPRVLLQSNMASPMTANARLASGPTTSELFASSRRMVSVVIGGCFFASVMQLFSLTAIP